MFRIQKWIREFFSISHAQANGIMVLLPLLTIILLSEPVWRWYAGRHQPDRSADRLALDSMIALWNSTGTGLLENKKTPDSPKAEPSAFNPNTAVREKLIKVGFSEKLATRIISYRSKGGSFKVRSDLMKIYGMDTVLYHQLSRYIELPLTLQRNVKPARRAYSLSVKPRKNETEIFDLNVADTTKLMQIQGIGKKLSARIIRYRDALGGFISSEQVAEVYGLDSVVVDRLSKSTYIGGSFTPRKININTATESVLADHPYFSGPEARSIVSYRFQHGPFASIEDLSRLSILKAHTIQRITPYLTISDE